MLHFYWTVFKATLFQVDDCKERCVPDLDIGDANSTALQSNTKTMNEHSLNMLGLRTLDDDDGVEWGEGFMSVEFLKHIQHGFICYTVLLSWKNLKI